MPARGRGVPPPILHRSASSSMQSFVPPAPSRRLIWFCSHSQKSLLLGGSRQSTDFARSVFQNEIQTLDEICEQGGRNQRTTVNTSSASHSLFGPPSYHGQTFASCKKKGKRGRACGWCTGLEMKRQKRQRLDCKWRGGHNFVLRTGKTHVHAAVIFEFHRRGW